MPVEGYSIPPLSVCIARYVEAARLTNPGVRCIGISVNASELDDAAYRRARASIEAQTQLHCTDPIREGVDGLIAAIENAFGKLTTKAAAAVESAVP